jgi:hypothetical protein
LEAEAVGEIVELQSHRVVGIGLKFNAADLDHSSFLPIALASLRAVRCTTLWYNCIVYWSKWQGSTWRADIAPQEEATADVVRIRDAAN